MGESRKALIVDDDPSGRMALGWLLEEQGFEIVEAESLAIARRHLDPTLALVILDVHLRDGDGPTLVPEVRAHAPKAKVVLFSGYHDASDARTADLSLTKGASANETIAAIMALVEGR